jgi:23S rRNA (cytosine1962-C5)-methyltransferase
VNLDDETMNQPSTHLESALERMRAFRSSRTNTYRLIHGEAHGWRGWSVDRFGGWLLSQSEGGLSPNQRGLLSELVAATPELRGAYHKKLDRHVRQAGPENSSPELAVGDAAPDEFDVMENGARYAISFREGYSVGLFLDQRENRGRIREKTIARGFSVFPNGAANSEVLNAFAYTCAFSVTAAGAGARVTSLDLSRKYLDWGRRNFHLNELDPEQHDFIYGDAFDWMKRLTKNLRLYDLIILDPPTFSKSKQRGVFKAEKHFGDLTAAALGLLRRGGVLYCSCNAARLSDEAFEAMIRGAVADAGRKVERSKAPEQPGDFPITRETPAYLKQLWLRVR